MTTPTANTITMFSAEWCRDCRRTKAQLDELGVEYTYIDLEADPAELRNVAGDPEYAEALHRMQAELARLQELYEDQPYTGPDTPRPDWGPALQQS